MHYYSQCSPIYQGVKCGRGHIKGWMRFLPPQGCVHRDQPASAKAYVCDGGMVSEVALQVPSSSLDENLMLPDTTASPTQLARAAAATILSSVAGTAAVTNRPTAAACADTAAATNSVPPTSVEAPVAAVLLVEGTPAGTERSVIKTIHGVDHPELDSRPAHPCPSPTDTHTAEQDNGGSEQTAGGKPDQSALDRHVDASRAAFPRAVAWEVPVSSPSQAVQHAEQSRRQSMGTVGQPADVRHAPLHRVSASPPVVRGVHTPPTQSSEATSPVRGVVPSYDSADRCATACWDSREFENVV